MDPLSITTGALACLAALTTTVKSVHTIVSLRKAAEEVQWLSNDLESIKALLHAIKSMLLRVQDTAAYHESRETISVLLQRLAEPLLELEGIIAYKLRSADGSKVSKSAWLRLGPRIKKLQQKIQEAKLDLAVGIGSLGLGFHQDVRDLMVSVDAIKVQSAKVLENLKSKEMPDDDDTIVVHDEYQSPMPLDSDVVVTQTKTKGEAASATIWVQTSMALRNCLLPCRCSCHRTRHFSTPSWARSIIGQLLVSYNGYSILTPATCDYPPCVKASRRTTMHYYFPEWLASRALSMDTILGVLNLRTSIVVPSADPVWAAVQRGDIGWFCSAEARPLWQPDIVDEKGWTLLHYAVEFAQPQAYRFLLDQGANPVIGDKTNMTPLALALRWNALQAFAGKFEDVTEQLDLNPLHLAILDKSTKFEESQMHADYHFVNVADRTGMSPLHWACRLGLTKMVRLLITWRADVNAQDRLGITSLHHACAANNIEVIDALVESGYSTHAIRLNQLDWTGHSALHFAIRCDSLAAAKRLIQLGVSTSAIDTDGRTLLHIIALYASPDMMQILSEADWSSTDPDQKDNHGMVADACFHADREKCYTAKKERDRVEEEMTWNLLRDSVAQSFKADL